MDKLNYCLDCKRIFDATHECTYCNSKNIKQLTKNSPVNIMGTKLKGRVFKTSQGKAHILLVDENNNKSIREYEASKIRKVL